MPTLKLPKNTLFVYFMSGFITTCRIINLHFAIECQNANLNKQFSSTAASFLDTSAHQPVSTSHPHYQIQG